MTTPAQVKPLPMFGGLTWMPEGHKEGQWWGHIVDSLGHSVVRNVSEHSANRLLIATVPITTPEDEQVARLASTAWAIEGSSIKSTSIVAGHREQAVSEYRKALEIAVAAIKLSNQNGATCIASNNTAIQRGEALLAKKG